MQDWTEPSELAEQVLRLWDKGRILSAKITGEALFPLSLRLRRPDTASYGGRFEDVRAWIRRLEDGSRTTRGFGYEVEWSDVNHRQIGRNRVPRAVIVRTQADALKLIVREKEASRFDEMAKITEVAFPNLLDWIARKPIAALDLASDWPQILTVIAWFTEHPRSGLYLRQLDIEGVDTKFIEARKPLLSELLDIVWRKEPRKQNGNPAPSFEVSYGLKARPATIRFRILDETFSIASMRDIATPATQFASLQIPVRHVFVTENEVNGLAFPDAAESIVVFGLGYGVDLLASIPWLKRCEVHYWGDIDTHGFAMLDRLRAASRCTVHVDGP